MALASPNSRPPNARRDRHDARSSLDRLVSEELAAHFDGGAATDDRPGGDCHPAALDPLGSGRRDAESGGVAAPGGAASFQDDQARTLLDPLEGHPRYVKLRDLHRCTLAYCIVTSAAVTLWHAPILES